MPGSADGYGDCQSLFVRTIARPDATMQDALDINISGAAMVRAAVRNFSHVIVVVTLTDQPHLSAYFSLRTIHKTSPITAIIAPEKNAGAKLPVTSYMTAPAAGARAPTPKAVNTIP